MKLSNDNIIMQSVDKIDKLAKIYETSLWYPIVYHIYGGLRIPSVKEIIKKITDMITIKGGVGLDIACGTWIYMRPIAKKTNRIYGIDISLGMLQKTKIIANKKTIGNIYLVRASVEKLPFPNEFFNAACCSGALHLFPDTLTSLKEIARILKPESSFVVMIFIKKRFLRHKFIYELLKEKHGSIIFVIKELESWLKKVGFKDFKPYIYGSMLLFSTRKKID